LLKDTVVLTDGFACNTNVVDVLFHKNTPTLSWGCHTSQVQTFR
jgi:hypothetical protein